MRPELEIVKGALAGHRYKVTEKGLRLGRSSSNDIHVPDWALSRSHCLFEAIGESGLRVTDLASANGTLLNGEALGGEPVDLKAGDVIEAGTVRVRVVLNGAENVVSPPLSATAEPVKPGRWGLYVLLGILTVVALVSAAAFGWLLMRSQAHVEDAQDRGRDVPVASEKAKASSVQRGEDVASATVGGVLQRDAGVVSVEKPVEKITTGALVIQSVPAGAIVKVNGSARGLTPLTVGNLPAGAVTIRLNKVGFEESVSEQTVVAGDAQNLTVALKALPPPPEVGRLEVRTDPVGAQVLVDGKPLGVTRASPTDAAHSDVLSAEGLSEGVHVLVVRMKGCTEVMRHVKIVKGQTAMANVRLKAAFVPNVEIVTSRGKYTGMLRAETPETVDLEVSPGITRTFPRKEIEQMRSLRKAE